MIEALGIDLTSLDDAERRIRASQAAAPLLQAAAVATGGQVTWGEQSDDALRAQGRASARGGAAFAQMIPRLPGLAQLLARPGATILDVGTGVGGMALACAEAVPGLHVLGIDVLPRAVTLARQAVASSGLEDRVEIRLQGAQDLTETDRFAAAWIPAPFIPETALRSGIPRVAAALVPGGWLCLAYGRLTGGPVERAITRFTTLSYGGTALEDSAARDLLRDAGLVDLTIPPTPQDNPAIALARRPEVPPRSRRHQL